jgi:hypothetical protein
VELLVNGKPVSVSPEESGTVQSLVDALRGQGAVPEGHAIIRLTIDSVTWDAAELMRYLPASVSSTAKVTVVTGATRPYGIELMDDMARMLSVLTDSASAVGKSLRQESPSEANSHLFRLLDALQQFVSCLYSIQTICGMKGKPLDVHRPLVQRMTESLNKVQLCQQEEAWSDLADCLERDLKPSLEGLRTIIEAMKDEF